MSVPAWCPNLGVCGYPDCVYDDEECAQAESLAGDDGGPEPEPTPADDEPFVPLTADDIDWNWKGR